MSTTPEAIAPAEVQKHRSGLNRVLHATGFSMAGLRAGWQESAFRQEAIASFVLVPAAFWLGRSWVETALLAGSVLLVMMVELLNTAVEAALDRSGPEWNAFAKKGKDMGSAAVFLALLLVVGIWGAALVQRFG